jgi:LPXTG-motif cell wall-anchored protein
MKNIGSLLTLSLIAVAFGAAPALASPPGPAPEIGASMAGMMLASALGVYLHRKKKR